MYFQSPPLLPRWNAHNTIAWRTAPTLLGTLRSNDADGNENVIKNNTFNKQNNNFARASHFFEHFFPVFARLRRENA